MTLTERVFIKTDPMLGLVPTTLILICKFKNKTPHSPFSLNEQSSNNRRKSCWWCPEIECPLSILKIIRQKCYFKKQQNTASCYLRKEREISNQEYNSHLNTESRGPLIKTCTSPLLIPVNHKDNISFKYIKCARKINTKTKGHWISPSHVSEYKSLSKKPARNAPHR